MQSRWNAARVDLLSYLRSTDGSPDDYLFWGTQATGAVRHGRWKLLDGALYELSRDVAEQHKVAAANPEVVANLLRARAAWVQTLAPSLW